MWQDQRNPETVTHSREDALNDTAFEALYEGAMRIDNDQRSLEARLAILLAGRLGLRAAEIVHLREEWVDWTKQRIEIPAHQDCQTGRDGGMCGHCRQAVKQCVLINDDVTWDEATESWWRPKTAAAVRAVPYRWAPRADLALTELFDGRGYDRYPKSLTSVGRDVSRAAELADGMDPDDIYPHALRATAGSHLAGRGLDAEPLMALMGWVQISTAEVYIACSDANVRRSLHRAHSQ